MTMLDRMRRHRDWLKWSLGLVCVAFVLFYIPDFLRGSGADAASSDTVARIEGRDITSGEFRRTYQAQLQAYRSAYGNQMSEQLLKQLGIDQQILQQMVDERAAWLRDVRRERHEPVAILWASEARGPARCHHHDRDGGRVHPLYDGRLDADRDDRHLVYGPRPHRRFPDPQSRRLSGRLEDLGGDVRRLQPCRRLQPDGRSV